MSVAVADPDQEIIDCRMNAIRHKILVVSGKGGKFYSIPNILKPERFIGWLCQFGRSRKINFSGCP